MSENEKLFERAVKSLPGGNIRTTLFVPPSTPYAVEGTGARVRDSDGHITIDCNNNYTALIHGHRPAHVLDAVRETLEWGISFGIATETEIQLAEVLRDRMPHMPHWRFGNSGTEAVMQAIRIARAATKRDIIIRFTGAYHGTADAVVDPSAPGIPKNITEVSKDLPIGDAAAFLAAMHEYGDQVAAVLVDFMPNRAGLVPATQEFADLLRKTTAEYGALLIVDEVIAYRMSRGGIQERYGIKPDLTTLGKTIGGGFPVGAVGGTEDVMQRTDPREVGHIAWGGTFSGNPITMAAGVATLSTFGQAEIDALNARGDQLREDLIAEGLKVTGAGSLLRVWPREGVTTSDMWWNLYKSGVMVATSGLLSLSSVMTDDDISQIRSAVIRAVA